MSKQEKLKQLQEIERTVSTIAEIEKQASEATGRKELYSEALLRLNVIKRQINALIMSEKQTLVGIF